MRSHDYAHFIKRFKMNLSVPNVSVTAPEQTLELLKSNWIGWICWVIFGTINIFFSLLSLITSITWKPLHSDMQILVRNLMVSECLFSITQVILAIIHIYHVQLGIPEISVKWQCFLVNFFAMCSMLISGVFYIFISFDKFFGAVFPIFYKNRNRFYGYCVTLLIWLTICLITLISHWEVFSTNDTIPVCFGKLTLTNSYLYLHSTSLTVVAVGAVITYVLLITYLNIRLIFNQKTGRTTSEIKTAE